VPQSFSKSARPSRRCARAPFLTLAVVTAGLAWFGPAGDAAAQTQSGRVVAEAKYTSPYDAYMKMNRLREGFLHDEDAAEYWGFMESRLSNQAGRILIKRPAKGVDDHAFRGWLMFIRAYGNATGIGNCTACHTVPDFTDKQKHNIGTAKEPILTPSLRDLADKKSFFHDGGASSLEEVITRHVENGRIARDDKRAGVEIELGKIALTEKEVRDVAAFLRSLHSVGRDHFREYLVDVVVQPVDLDFSD
jgi:cytochrome c peroxidase